MTNHFLGFDLGHADTAIALLGGSVHERFAAPANIEIQGQSIQPTALVRIEKDGQQAIIIGGRAIREASKAENKSARLRAAFKTRPRALGDAKEDIADFFAASLAEARFEPLQPEGWAATAIAVGCPSGWSAAEDIEQYQEILKQGIAGTPYADADIRVVPESRAALLQAIDNPNSPLTTKARQENILVIDIGSSTLDFSLIAPEQKAAPLLDAGLDLGASFFDRQLLAQVLGDEPQAAKFLGHNPHYKDLWQYYARRTKEQFFIDAPTSDDEVVSGAPIQPYFVGGRRRSLEITVTGHVFDRIRQTPFDRALHPSPELAMDPKLLEGKSWEEVYRASLGALKDAIERRSTTYGRVLLAGGASRMPFTEDIAREVFDPRGEGLVLRDPEPSHMVSRGLARWGRKRENVDRFSREARRVLDDHLSGFIKSSFDPLKDRLTKDLAGEMFERFVAPVLEQWKAGAFKTGHDVRAEIERSYQNWLQSEEGTAFFVGSINGWWRDEIKHQLDKELDRLHAAYDISPDIQLQFERAIDPDVFPFSARSIDLPFEAMISAILLTTAFAVTIAIDATMGGIPFFTGGLAAAAAVGGRPLRHLIASLDVPAFARKLPDRMPGRERLFGGQVRSRVEKQLKASLARAQDTLTEQVEAAVKASVEGQIRRARVLLMGMDAGASKLSASASKLSG